MLGRLQDRAQRPLGRRPDASATNSRLPTTMQQKYCDQGRSIALLTTTWPIFFARSSCGPGESRGTHRSCPRRGAASPRPADASTQVMSLRGIEPDVGLPCWQEDVLGDSSAEHGDGLALQVADRPDALGAEQLEAADVDAGQDHDRRSSRRARG